MKDRDRRCWSRASGLKWVRGEREIGNRAAA
jgi:hypothetical protein